MSIFFCINIYLPVPRSVINTIVSRGFVLVVALPHLHVHLVRVCGRARQRACALPRHVVGVVGGVVHGYHRAVVAKDAALLYFC
jgi:hypothetical protein